MKLADNLSVIAMYVFAGQIVVLLFQNTVPCYQITGYMTEVIPPYKASGFSSGEILLFLADLPLVFFYHKQRGKKSTRKPIPECSKGGPGPFLTIIVGGQMPPPQSL